MQMKFHRQELPMSAYEKNHHSVLQEQTILFIFSATLTLCHDKFQFSVPRVVNRLMMQITDYGRPMKPFFIEIPNLGFGRQFGQISFGAFGSILGRFISTHFGAVIPLSMFSIIHPLFLQKTKTLYPNPKHLFGVGI